MALALACLFIGHDTRGPTALEAAWRLDIGNETVAVAGFARRRGSGTMAQKIDDPDCKVSPNCAGAEESV